MKKTYEEDFIKEVVENLKKHGLTQTCKKYHEVPESTIASWKYKFDPVQHVVKTRTPEEKKAICDFYVKHGRKKTIVKFKIAAETLNSILTEMGVPRQARKPGPRPGFKLSYEKVDIPSPAAKEKEASSKKAVVLLVDLDQLADVLKGLK